MIRLKIHYLIDRWLVISHVGTPVYRAGFNNEGFVNSSDSRVQVRFDGRVHWSVPLHIRSACPVDATFFPYDNQSCAIHFGSWIYDYDTLDIQIDSELADTRGYIVNNEFDLTEASLKVGPHFRVCNLRGVISMGVDYVSHSVTARVGRE